MVHATARALYSTMLTRATWNALLHAQDLDAVLNVLSKTVYGPYLQLERRLLTPRRVAYQIRWHLADVYGKLIRLTPEPGEQLLRQLWRHYEVDNLKATLRGIEMGATWDQVLHLLYPMKKYIFLTASDMQRMVQSGEMARAVEYTRHTPYYDTLVHALDRYQTEHSLFPLEVALDLHYRRRLWQSIYQLEGLDLKQALRTVGIALDIDNLLWAIRYRIYHHLSEQEIINYTLPEGYEVKDEHIRAIAAGANIAEVVQRIYPDLESVGEISDQSHAGLAKLELLLNRYFLKVCRSAFIGYPFHIGIPVAYLWLNEHEIRDLTVLVEAKASHSPIETFGPLLEMQPLSDRADQR
jgi:vacuolar-type H+-ATPase subunit C/Vma6